MIDERNVEVDHSTLHRWVLKYVPTLEKAFLAHERLVGGSWRLDETYVRVKGAWKYLYRAVDKADATVDFRLTARRDRKAALRFLRKAIDCHGVPEKITIDGANTAAIVSYNADHGTAVEIRQVKYLNNIVEQDHRAIKRMVRPMLGFKTFWSAAITITGIEDPQRSIAIDRKIVSSAAVLFAGGISLFRLLDRIQPVAQFAIEPSYVLGLQACDKMLIGDSLPGITGYDFVASTAEC
jgi:putative transposase